MLNIELCRVTRTAERPWGGTAGAIIEEGQALRGTYDEGGVMQVSASAAETDVFAGVSQSRISNIEELPAIETFTLGDTGVSTRTFALKNAAIAGSISVQNPADASTVDWEPAAEANAGAVNAAGEWHVAGTTVTVHNTGGDKITIAYRYKPTAEELRRLQGDLEPGVHTTAEQGSTTVIEEGDVYTSFWDTAADWETARSGLVKLGAGGRFTPATATDLGEGQVAGRVIQYPTEEGDLLGVAISV